MRYIASLSGGKDSVAMVLLLLERKMPLDEVIFFDTGWEFEAIYNVINKVENILKENNVKLTRLYPSKSFEYLAFDHNINHRDGTKSKGYGWCGNSCRWGTTYKKLSIDKYYKSIDDDITEYIGIAYDEPQRIKEGTKTIKVYPLYDNKMTEKDCLNYCYNNGFSWIERERESCTTFLTEFLVGVVQIKI